MTGHNYVWVAIVDLGEMQVGIFGLETEGEDILTHILDWDSVPLLIKSGEVDSSAMLVSLLWLQLNSARLRKAWGGA